jgi:glutamyl-tRNA synthetase
MVRVRYAPSPTGEIHIGNARTALFNYLFARHHKGTFILRLDDTDRKRSTDEAIESMVEDITWLGLDWDEGYLKDGPYGPYRQSERMDIYNHYIDILLENGSAYELYYTDSEIENLRNEYEKEKKTFSYRVLKELELESKVRELKEKGYTPAVVFKVEQGRDIVVHDLVRGDVHFNSSEFSDFVIRRENGFPVYNYTTVIDDALMKITHVIRAEEHLSNTPKHILLFNALNFPLPTFSHLSLIFAPDRTKLSKRHGATSIGEFRRMGFLPQALFNFLALLGWSPKDEREFFTKEELIELFTLESVNKAPAIFDINKLKWMNHKYIVELPSEEILAITKEFGIALPQRSDKWWNDFIEITKEHFDMLQDIVTLSQDFFSDFEIRSEIFEELKSYNPLDLLVDFRRNLEQLDIWERESILDTIRETGRSLKIKGKALYFPIRLAITGKEEGLEIHDFIYLLGKEETLRRLGEVIKLLENLRVA